MKPILIQTAWCAVKAKDSYWAAQFARLRRNLGTKKAIVAIAHMILKVIYLMLKKQTPYTELGAAYANKFSQEKQAEYHIKKLQSLGHNVTVAAKTEAAVTV